MLEAYNISLSFDKPVLKHQLQGQKRSGNGIGR